MIDNNENVTIWWCAGALSVQPVSVIRETESSLVLAKTDYRGKNKMVRKRGDYESYFKTWQEAKDFLVQKQQAEFERAQSHVQYEYEKLLKVKALQKQQLPKTTDSNENIDLTGRI